MSTFNNLKNATFGSIALMVSATFVSAQDLPSFDQFLSQNPMFNMSNTTQGFAPAMPQMPQFNLPSPNLPSFNDLGNQAGRWVSNDLATPPSDYWAPSTIYSGANTIIKQGPLDIVGFYAGYIRNLTKATGQAGNGYATMVRRQYYGQNPWGW